MKFATLIIFACLKCVTVKSLGFLSVENKSSNKTATAAELTQVYDSEINDGAIFNADKQAEAERGLKGSVREAMVCTPLWYINCDGVCVMNCDLDIGGSCGGLAKPWDTLHVKKSECCEKKLTSIGVSHDMQQRDECLASCHSPTPAPINIPSNCPSQAPSSNPSETTENPSSIPSKKPSTNPSSNPSETTAISSSNPSKYPSSNPSEYPSSNPNISPTSKPTTSQPISPMPTTSKPATQASTTKPTKTSKPTRRAPITSKPRRML